MSNASIPLCTDDNERVARSRYSTVTVPCVQCGDLRALMVSGPVQAAQVAQRMCRSCASLTNARTRWLNRLRGTEDFDWAAVDNMMHGIRVPRSTHLDAERTEAVARLTARGLTAKAIAELLHTTPRSVVRRRAVLRLRATYQDDEVA